jgi:succinoglycan biosynthesis protein ExoW
MTPHKLKIAVVIPFYQKEAGLLRKAIKSAINQDYKCVMDIIIIDDGSPTPAYPECDGLEYDEKRIQIRIIRQKNKGYPAAINLGLENIIPDTDFVAFLDSDDEWSKVHLSTIFNHRQDFDFYFCTHIRYDVDKNLFPNNKIPLPFTHTQDIKGTDLKELKGDRVQDFFLRKFKGVGAPTFILNWKKHSSIRWSERLVTASDDLYLVTILLNNQNKILYSELINLKAGKGVNIFYNLPTWESIHALKNLYNSLLLSQEYKTLLKDYPQYSDHLKKRQLKLYTEVCACFNHAVFNRKPIVWKLVWNILKIEPTILFWYWPLTFKLLTQKIKNYSKNQSDLSPNIKKSNEA